ncbi:MAG: methyltransferase domain-containing protein [Desulfobacterales bacterium]
MAKMLQERVCAPEEIRVLDLGCGTGSQVELLDRMGFNAIGLDLSAAMLAHAKKKAHKRGAAGFELVMADAFNLPFASSAFDAVTIQLVLHEMDREIMLGVLQEMKRVAREDALFLVIDFVGPTVFNPITCLIRMAEFSAGLRHYRNSRDFVRAGGLPYWLGKTGFRISDCFPYFFGCVHLAVAHSLAPHLSGRR